LHLDFGGVLKGPVSQLVVLGSVLSSDSCEKAAFSHRISQAWKCFFKWQHILMAPANLDDKFALWMKTVYRSMVWGLQTCRLEQGLLQRLATVQKLMVRKFMGLKRRPTIFQGERLGTEEWLAWQIRSMSRAGSETRARSLGIAELVQQERLSWAGHVARFGLHDKQTHVAKYLVAWRCLAWWRLQQWFKDIGWNSLKHTFPFLPRRWEDGLPAAWMNALCQPVNKSN
jgi:hypothetical protein